MLPQGNNDLRHLAQLLYMQTLKPYKMKHNINKITIVAALVLFAATFTACNKGAQGDPGPTGATGANGNANVLSGQATVHSGDWIWDASYADNYINLEVDDITQDVLDNGTVSVFFADNSNGWIGMPYTDYPTTTTSYTYNFDAYYHGLTITLIYSDGSNIVPGSITFKIVSIGGAFRKAHTGTNWHNYNEVMALAQGQPTSAISIKTVTK